MASRVGNLRETDASATIAYDALLLRRYHMHKNQLVNYISSCLLYTSDAADE